MHKKNEIEVTFHIKHEKNKNKTRSRIPSLQVTVQVKDSYLVLYMESELNVIFLHPMTRPDVNATSSNY